MNEIDPPANNSNGSLSTAENHQDTLVSAAKSTPLLSSLLVSSKNHESSPPVISNGQQEKQSTNAAHDLMMSVSPGGGGTSAIVANPQYEKRISPKQPTEIELDLSSSGGGSVGGHKKLSTLNELLQRNINNNSETSTTKSILENCLLKPKSSHRLESHQPQQQTQYHYNYNQNKMDESGTPSSLLKFAHQEENRKVEPLKINLNREPIRTVIKLPTNNLYDSPTKITIKSPQPPSERSAVSLGSTATSAATQSISPTLSSSSSLSSESSYDTYGSDIQQRSSSSSIQVVPKLHLRNLLDTPHHEQSELHIVPKLTITGLNSSQTSSSLSQQQQLDNDQLLATRDHSVNNILDTPTIPKLTIKKDNNSEASYHLNHDTIPKLHIKTSNHHHHHPKEGLKMTIKQPELMNPPVPKLTIKTTENDTMTVINSTSQPFESERQASIPKITIKANQHSVTPKITIKPLLRPEEQLIVEQEKDDQEESIPKLTLKAVHNNSNTSDAPTFEKIVPKLVVKLPKEAVSSQDDEKESSSCSSTPSPPLLHVSKLNIKPISSPEKEVPSKQSLLDLTTRATTTTSPIQQPDFSINRLIGATTSEVEVNLKSKPLEINTNAKGAENSGLDSPRIILKINKTNNESLTTEIVQPTSENNLQQKSAVNNNSSNKRAHSNDFNDDKDEDGCEEETKKPKLAHEDVIVINDSDASSEASSHMNKNHQNNSNHEANSKEQQQQHLAIDSQMKIDTNDESNTATTIDSNTELVATNKASARSLRQSRRNNDVASKRQTASQKNATAAVVVEESPKAPTVDPLALDAIANTNSNDEIITPKRGRGRPKKSLQVKQQNDQSEKSLSSAAIEVDSESRDPLEIPSANATDEQPTDEKTQISNSVEEKKTPGRGRGRGRGRLKRTIEVMKNGKPIQITLEGHDDDDSPSFSLYNRNSLRGGLSKRGTRGGKTPRGGKSSTKMSASSPFITPERSKDGNFTSPLNNSDFKDNSRRKIFSTPSLFEEDTRMSIGGGDSQTPQRLIELHSNEESQSSILSSTSNTVEGSVKKRLKKMEVCEPEGRTEFTIDLLAEYDWPQNEPPRSRDAYMIQEQIAEYLGIKSFKRKYPDLMRRPVEMEERNFLFENGLASEKMCDLGLTAVYANEILDIMCNDYPEKYEEYKRYQREKAFRNARLRSETAVVDRSQMQKDKAITSTSDWNSRFNKDRRENRRCCMDLQNFLIQKPTPIRDYKVTPSVSYTTAYPAALVPGQFSEFYEKYTPEQLACYPINTILVDFNKLDQYMATHPNPYDFSDESSSDSEDENDSKDGSSSDSSDSDSSDSESSSGDEYEDPKCSVCSETPFSNRFNQPEKFIKCSTCKNEAHPSCIDMSQRMYVRSLAYKWQCYNCKTCLKCQKQKDNKMLFCTQCDRGYHIYCLGLRNVPEGQYHCVNCTICSECGAKTPEGHFNAALTQQQRQDLAMIAQWNHEFTINPLTNMQEHKASLCLPCFRKGKKSDEDDKKDP